MNAPDAIPAGWSRGRFLLVAALLFAGQVGWVLLLGERARPAPVAPAPGMLLRLLNTPLDDAKWTQCVFAGDPAVFASSSPHGFADQAWRRLPVMDYAAALPEPRPAFLGFAAGRSGAVPNPPALDSQQAVFQLPAPTDSSPDTPPAVAAAQASRPESLLRIAGALADRQLNPPPVLPSWTTNFLVGNSVVYFGVNRAGQVISEMLQTGSGLQEADLSALATVKGLRFRPTGKSAPEIAWDTATFYWRTAEPPQKTGQ